MIAAGLRGKRGSGFAADAVTEDRGALVVETRVVVVGEDVLGAPPAVNELSHASSRTAGVTAAVLSYFTGLCRK
jgi:hypothetical protein